MRVAVVGPAPPFRGGIALHTEALLRALATGHEVWAHPFARQYPRLLFPGRSQIDPSAVALAEADRALDPYRPSTWHPVAHRIEARGADVVLMQWWHPWFAPCTAGLLRRLQRAAPRCRRILLTHNVLPHKPVPAQRLLARWALSSAELLIVHADREATRARQLLPNARLHRMSLPCFASDAIAPSRDEARRLLGLPSGPLVLFFGLVRGYKGLDDLIDAMARMSSTTRLLVAGEFYESIAATRRRIAAHGLEDRVLLRDRFAPAEEVPLLFAAADAVALPYRSATQSAVLPLAVHYRRPFVATDVGGLADAAAGIGVIVPPRQPAALARGLGEILARPVPSEAQFAAAAATFASDNVRAGIEAAVAALGGPEADRAA